MRAMEEDLRVQNYYSALHAQQQEYTNYALGVRSYGTGFVSDSSLIAESLFSTITKGLENRSVFKAFFVLQTYVGLISRRRKEGPQRPGNRADRHTL